MRLPKPVSPDVNPINPSTEEDEVTEDGGSDDELTDVEDVFIEEEAEEPKRICREMRPSKEEVDVHNRTHLPYRSWCPHCVKGKARRRNHRRRRRSVKDSIPVISLDYMWMKGKKGDGQDDVKGSPILVAHCRETKVTWSRVLLKKGVDPYSIKVLTDMVLFTGHKRVILKSDGESSITALKNAVKGSVNVSLGVEASPVGDSKANG